MDLVEMLRSTAAEGIKNRNFLGREKLVITLLTDAADEIEKLKKVQS